jgi:hypothetical protein
VLEAPELHGVLFRVDAYDESYEKHKVNCKKLSGNINSTTNTQTCISAGCHVDVSTFFGFNCIPDDKDVTSVDDKDGEGVTVEGGEATYLGTLDLGPELKLHCAWTSDDNLLNLVYRNGNATPPLVGSKRWPFTKNDGVIPILMKNPPLVERSMIPTVDGDDEMYEFMYEINWWAVLTQNETAEKKAAEEELKVAAEAAAAEAEAEEKKKVAAAEEKKKVAAEKKDGEARMMRMYGVW